jgi:RNA polymerase-binding transcription factor DksA
MKKKPAKKTIKASKKANPKKVVKKAKPAAKKNKPAAKKSKPIAKKTVHPKKKIAKKPVKIKHKPEPKKVMKKPEPKKGKTEVKKAPVTTAKKTTQAASKGSLQIKPAPKAEVKPIPVEKVEPKKVTSSDKAAKVSDANEKKHYSEKELVEFRTLIVGKLDQARKDYDLLKNTLCHTDDHGTDDTSPTFKALEDGSDVLTREETAQLALRQEKFIQNLQNALVRIQNKTYGVCRVTGKLIPKERLLRVPHATLSIDAKMVQQFNQ